MTDPAAAARQASADELAAAVRALGEVVARVQVGERGLDGELARATREVVGAERRVRSLTPARVSVSVRVPGDEFERWEAAREASGRESLADWIRATINDALADQSGRPRPGARPVVPEANHEAAGQLARVGNNLNQIARELHAAHGEAADPLVEAIGDTLGEVSVAARALLGPAP